jgi:hypothetical protein
MSNATYFLLQAHLPAIFLDAIRRAQHEFDPNHHDIYGIVAGMRTNINNLADWHGSDFENVWSSGMTHQLPFKCNPNPNVQLIWHLGCPKLLTKRMHERGAPNAVHQQMPILCMTFTSREMQHMAGVSLTLLSTPCPLATSWVLVVPHPNPLNQVHSVVLVVAVALAAVALAAVALAALALAAAVASAAAVTVAVAEAVLAAVGASVATEDQATNTKLSLLIALECYPVQRL